MVRPTLARRAAILPTLIKNTGNLMARAFTTKPKGAWHMRVFSYLDSHNTWYRGNSYNRDILSISELYPR